MAGQQTKKKAALVVTKTEDRDLPMEKIRNIGIIAHIDAGKTTTTERILFETGKTYKQGSVDDGTTATDWMEQERERGITIVSAAITTFWDLQTKSSVENGHYRINIIDTPGHIDFTAEVERSLRVLDGAVMVFDGRTGVESQSETVWRQADRYKVPRICILNKLNLIGADFEGSIKSINDKLRANTAPIQLPIGLEHDLHGIVDLIKMKAYTYSGVEDNKLKEEEIPSDLLDMAKKYREELIEKVAEYDDGALSKYLEGEELTEADIKKAIRKGVISGKFFPILGGDNRTATAQLLLETCPYRLEKVRLRPDPWKLDLFKDPLGDLTWAEIDVSTTDEEPLLPHWISEAREITSELTNYHLARLAADLRGVTGKKPFERLLARIPKIVVTGGPCSGKSTLMQIFSQVPLHQVRLHFVPEVATILISQVGAKPPVGDPVAMRRFQRTVYTVQTGFEEVSETQALMDGKTALITDRGVVDSAAYLPNGLRDLEGICRTSASYELGRYDLVIHLDVPEKGVYEESRRNNPARSEGWEEATALDQRIGDIWGQHHRYVRVERCGNMEIKLLKASNIISDFLNKTAS